MEPEARILTQINAAYRLGRVASASVRCAYYQARMGKTVMEAVQDQIIAFKQRGFFRFNGAEDDDVA